MATTRENTTCRLTARVESGVDESGKAKTSDRSISSCNPVLTDDDARTIIDAYAALQNYPLSAALRTDSVVLVEGTQG